MTKDKGREAMPQVIQKNVAQQMVEAVKDVCKHDINFIDINGIIFASTDTKRIGDYHEVGHKVAQSGEGIEVETDNSFLGTNKGVNIPFVYKSEICAVIGITGNPSEVRQYAYLSQKLMTLILREHELDLYERTQKTQLNHVIRTLIRNGYANQPYVTEFLNRHQIDIQTDYRAVTVKVDAYASSGHAVFNEASIEKNIYHAFEQTGSFLYTFNYPNEYILLIESGQFKKWRYLFDVLAEKNFPTVKIGVGNVVPLPKLHHSYKAAKVALRSLFGEDRIAVFEELDLELLLGNITDDVRDYFLEKTIKALSDEEQELLKIYFSTDMSLKKTCEQMFIHKNTLQYQLDKIGRQTGFNPRKFQEASILYLALKMNSMK